MQTVPPWARSSQCHHAGPEEAVNAVASDVIVFVKKPPKGLDILNFHARGSK